MQIKADINMKAKQKQIIIMDKGFISVFQRVIFNF